MSPRRVLARSLFAVIFLQGGLPVRADDVARPIPQDPEKQRQRIGEWHDWNVRTLAGAYDKVGKKDPRWDRPAREAMLAAADFFSDLSDAVVKLDRIHVAAKKAVAAGCDDPLVLYLYSRTSYFANHPGADELRRRTLAAATAMERSHYPAFRRAVALIKAGAAVVEAKNLQPAQREEAQHCFEAALTALCDGAVKREATPPFGRGQLDFWRQLKEGFRRLPGDHKAAFDHVDAAMAKVPSLKVIRLKLTGDFYMWYAWEARGAGFAKTVTEDGWTKFVERLSTARKALREAWELQPGDAEVATLMVNIEKGLGGNRDEMEKWFERAMKADPDNRLACWYKLDWLDPKWHGAPEAMVAFGRACRDTKNWHSQIPLLAADAHLRMLQHLPQDERRKYLDANVWDDVRSVYDEYLKRYPRDDANRSRYAGFCYMCGHLLEADRNFKLVGDNLAWSEDMPEQWLKDARNRSAESVRAKPPAPPAEKPDK